jgi:acetyl-CoA carboxylase biotin carboxyl carrier protein
VTYAAPPAVPLPSASAAPPTPVVAHAKPAPAEDEANVVVIKSPMVGTFYSRSNPNAEPYVRVGDDVDEGTVVCVIEAMKVFNEIPAEVNGRIVAVLVEDEEPVDFGRPLFKVDTKT